jgi:UDP:flavonoid glycosyltransferase YjiC (YdhE family)
MESPIEENYLMAKPLSMRKLRILVAPLDWGLGHATRCIPVIRELIMQGAEVTIACEGAQEILLKQEFPTLAYLPLAGYQVQYNRSRLGSIWKLMWQVPKIMAAIRKEHTWLKELISTQAFDAVISDNRFGLYAPGITCIFMTHQLRIKSPIGKWAENILQRRNYKFITKFAACWVPDETGANNLAGELSHPATLPKIPVQYLGILSRLGTNSKPFSPRHLLIILSGPEPQRSILENMIIRDIAHYPASATIVRGLPSGASIIPSTNMIRFYNHLPAAELQDEFQRAEYIIARSGYSTIMDIATMNKKAILIPTPGQSEQEYLANRLSGKKQAICIDQKRFNLKLAIDQADGFQYQPMPQGGQNNLSTVIQQFLTSLH